MRRFTFLAIAALCVLTASSALVAQSPPLTPFRGLIDHVSVDPLAGATPAARSGTARSAATAAMSS